MDPNNPSPRDHFPPTKYPPIKFQSKIPIFSKNDDKVAWWPKSSKKVVNSEILIGLRVFYTFLSTVDHISVSMY